MNFLQLLEEQLRQQRPAFQPTAVEGLLQQPQQDSVQAYSPETFVPEGLLNRHTARNVARGAGLLGLGFAPGAGVGDYAGQFPSFQGGLEPGFAENVEQGNYGTAALQSLGAFGDLAMTVPVLGAVVGSAAKAPRAIQRATRMRGEQPSVMPQVDELGFYSQVEKSLLDIPQQKGTGEQFLAQLQKSPGVRPEEIQYTGLDRFLASRPSVTKAEVQDYLDANRVQVQEVKLGSPQTLEARDSTIAQRYGYEADFDDGQMSFYDPSLSDYVEFQDLPAAMQTELLNQQTEFVGATKFSQYTIPGGENYREVLLTLPLKSQTTELPSTYRIIDDAEEARRAGLPIPEGEVGPFTFEGPNTSSRAFPTREEALEAARADVERERQFGISENVDATFRSSHFDQPNILAHMRVNDRTVDGKRTMFIEEVQSDWHQAGRKQGYKTGQERKATKANKMEGYWEVRDQNDQFITNVIDTRQDEAGALATANARLAENDPMRIASSTRVPDAPFKTSWDELTLKRAIKMASDDGYEQIAFTTGRTQADRYDLSKQINELSYRKMDDQMTINLGDGVYYEVTAVDKSGRPSLRKQVTEAELPDLVGKEMAEKIIKGEGKSYPSGSVSEGSKFFSDLDLRVGGEGMKAFYDRMLPKRLEKIGKKYGAKPTKSTMQTPDGEVEVWTFDIPADMRDVVREQGLPLFQIGAGAAGLGAAGLLATEEEQY